jgi:hypothetical protein
MSALFASGRIIDLILVLVVLEAVGLVVWHRRTGHGLAPGAMAATIGSGVALMLAVRAALVGAWWGWVALPLLAALMAHLVDLRGRWKG